MQQSPLSLHDVFNAVDLTERTVLASGTPFTPVLPQPLYDCLLLVVAPNVLNVLSLTGVHKILWLIATVCITIIADEPRVFNEFEMTLYMAITNRSKLETFRWMPENWIASLATPQAVHEIKHVDVMNENAGFDILMRLEPFLEIAHRSIDVFKILNNSLMTLYSFGGKTEFNRLMPVNYSFFHSQFSLYSDMAQTNNEVKETLLELCQDLEKINREASHQNGRGPKKSIIDPSTQKLRGCQTKSTSSKVNHTSVPPSTKMVDAFQVNELHRSQRGTDKRPKRHKCPVCQLAGHHGRTCRNILIKENAERADAFLKDLIEKQKIDSYISSLAKRERHSFVQDVLNRIQKLSGSAKGSDLRH